MNVIKIVFSPTGGTKRVVDAILQGSTMDEKTIDLTKKEFEFDDENDQKDRGLNSDIEMDRDSLVFIALPSYSGRAPETAIKRLKKIRGNQTRCVLVVAYGNREYEDTLVEMYDTAVACGFVPVAAISAIAEHSIDRSIAKERPDHADRELLCTYGKQIFDSIDKINKLENVPGNRPYKALPSGSNCPKADETCVKCGKCEATCPVLAIDQDMNGDPEKCISCMHCIAVCPVEARKLDEDTRKRIHDYLQMNCKVRKEPEIFINVKLP